MWIILHFIEKCKCHSIFILEVECLDKAGRGSKMMSRVQKQKVSSVNKKSCRDDGATLGRNKAPRRIKTSTP
jgi:hypothetical protein